MVSVAAGPYIDAFGYDESFDGSAIEAAASGVFSFTPEYGVQLDGALHRYFVDYGPFNETTTEFDGALHGFFRNDQFLVGGFLQAGKSGISIDHNTPGTWGRLYAGIEAQAYLDNITLYGQIGGSKTTMDDTKSYDIRSWFATAELRYFLTDNLRLDVHGGVDKTQFDGGDGEMTTYNFGLGAEYRLDDSPISLFGALDYQKNTVEPRREDATLRLMVGVKFNFGDETLKERDRTGPTLKLVPPSMLYGGTS